MPDKVAQLIVFCLIIGFGLINAKANAFTPNWSSDAVLPGNQKCALSHGKNICMRDGNRENIFKQDASAYEISIKNGAKYALDYPVDVSKLRLPKKAMDKFFNSDDRSLIRRFIFRIAKSLSKFETFQDLFDWMGLKTYPKNESERGPNLIPNMGELENYSMGVSIFHKQSSYPSMTFSCAACHSANLFGVKVLGMTNRFSRANEIFILGKKSLLASNKTLFKVMVGAKQEDVETYTHSRKAIKYVDLKRPLALGLDTSLAQVGLSLALRNQDEYATKPKKIKKRDSGLNHYPADSKPAVWWNLKYKTKWLSDASIRSGNPVHTNFLWNELGRGVDLVELEKWLINNSKKVKDLTAYAFQTKPPRYNDFFPSTINLNKAKSGEQLFFKNCSSCHGVYEKGWNSKSANTFKEKIATTKIWYHEKTVTRNVGTDPYRRKGMGYFAEDLNRLKISKSIGTVVQEQKGYVPPPLVGIWARWPYFHNNSVPSLYDVLTPAERRPMTYISVPAEDKYLDFDQEKNGYPEKENVRQKYKNDKNHLFDTRIRGLSNSGHTKMLLNSDGSEKFTHDQKKELIHFLKTL